MKLSIVIPVFNEDKTIEDVLKKVQSFNFDKEIIVVDDGSTDNTKEILKRLESDKIKVMYHSKNLGKGKALKTGFKNVTGDIVIIQDGDLEYDPENYSQLIDPILKGSADVVYGSRLSGGRPQRVYLFWHRIANNILSLVANIIYNTTLTDIETGYKVFKRELIDSIDIKSKDFTVEAELTAKIFKRHNIRVYEIPISYYGRSYSEGKKIRWYHAITAIWALIKYRFID